MGMAWAERCWKQVGKDRAGGRVFRLVGLRWAWVDVGFGAGGLEWMLRRGRRGGVGR